MTHHSQPRSTAHVLDLRIRNPMRASRTAIPTTLLDPAIAHRAQARPLQPGTVLGLLAQLLLKPVLPPLDLFELMLALSVLALLEPAPERLFLFFEPLALLALRLGFARVLLQLLPNLA